MGVKVELNRLWYSGENVTTMLYRLHIISFTNRNSIEFSGSCLVAFWFAALQNVSSMTAHIFRNGHVFKEEVVPNVRLVPTRRLLAVN